jgi:branched-chain amino acid transport system permease protein
MNLRVMKFRKFKRLLDPYFGVIVAALTLAFGAVLVIEMTYHLTLDIALGPVVTIFGFPYDTSRPEAWVFAAAVVAGGAAAFDYTRRRFKAEWDQIQIEIEDWIRDNPED